MYYLRDYNSLITNSQTPTPIGNLEDSKIRIWLNIFRAHIFNIAHHSLRSSLLMILSKREIIFL
jgi:hypothetical protein